MPLPERSSSLCRYAVHTAEYASYQCVQFRHSQRRVPLPTVVILRPLHLLDQHGVLRLDRLQRLQYE